MTLCFGHLLKELYFLDGQNLGIFYRVLSWKYLQEYYFQDISFMYQKLSVFLLVICF